MHNGRRLQLAQQQQQLAGGFFSSQVERYKAINRRMRGGRDVDAHHFEIRELRQKPLAQIARNAGNHNGWFGRIHLVAVVSLLGRRLCSPWRWRHGWIPGGAEVGIVQVDIALKTLHAIAIALAGNNFDDLRFRRIQR